MWLKLRNDPDVTFADDHSTEDGPLWITEVDYGALA